MHATSRKILVVDDDAAVCDLHCKLLNDLGYSPIALSDAEKFEETVTLNSEIELVLLDLNLNGPSGEQILERLKLIRPNIGVIMVTVVSDLQTAIRTIKSGAYNYLLKPLDPTQLKNTLLSFFDSNRTMPSDDPRFASFLTRSKKMQEVFAVVSSFAPSEFPIFIEGEEGTGKDLIARIIHSCSSRSDKSFLEVNLSSLPKEVHELELFGTSQRGYLKSGVLSQVPDGTIHIKEFDALSVTLRRRLINALLDRRFRSSGEGVENQIGARVIVSKTTRYLDQSERVKTSLILRERFSAQFISLPPLRERDNDIEFLALYFVRKYAAQFERKIFGIETTALRLLKRYSYPGNVRELESIMTAAVLLETTGYIQVSSLPANLLNKHSEPDLKALKRDLILKTIAECNGNQTQSARKLGIARATLNRFMKQYRKEKEYLPSARKS